MARPELDRLIAGGNVSEDAALAAVALVASRGMAVSGVLGRQSVTPTVRERRGRLGKITDRTAGTREQMAAMAGLSLSLPPEALLLSPLADL